jgi:hypothetical protein
MDTSTDTASRQQNGASERSVSTITAYHRVSCLYLITTSNNEVRLTARNRDNDMIKRSMTEFGLISAEIRHCRAPERGNDGCRRVLVSFVDSYPRSFIITLTDLLVHYQSQRDVSGTMPKNALKSSQAPRVAVVGGDIESDSDQKDDREPAKSGRSQPRYWHSEGPRRRHR